MKPNPSTPSKISSEGKSEKRLTKGILIGGITGLLLGIVSGFLIVAISGKQWFLLFGTIPDQMIAWGTLGAIIGGLSLLAREGSK